MRKWGGHRARQWTAAVLARYGRECVLKLDGCTHVATTGDHIKPRKVRPDLEYVVENGRPACLPCNQKRGTRDLADVAIVVDATQFFESAPPTPMDNNPFRPRLTPPTSGRES